MSSEKKSSFRDEVSAARMPYEGKAPEKWWAHDSVRGFYVVVSRPDATGQVQRWYAVRYSVPDEDGSKVDRKPKLGLVGVVRYSKALSDAASAMERARESRSSGKPVLPTLLEAFEDYIEFKTTSVANKNKLLPPTVKDYRDRWHDLIPTDWHTRRLDELTVEKWEQLRMQCTTPLSFEARLRKPVSESRFDVMMKGAISGLYRRQAETHTTLVNPVTRMRHRGTITQRTNEKDEYIATERLPAVVRHAEQHMRGPQRDILWIGLLTGWRNALLCRIPLDRIKIDKRAVEWRVGDRGGPYIEGNIKTFDYPVSDLLWERVFAPRLAALKPRQKYLIESGRRPGSTFEDVRDSLKMLDEVAGVHVTAHVLRRTMLTLAPGAKVHQRIVSHLAMHKSSSGTSAMTAQYQKRDFVLMKEGANQWATWFAEQVGWTEGTAKEPAQPPIQGVSEEKLAKLQALASMDPAALDKLLRLAEAMK